MPVIEVELRRHTAFEEGRSFGDGGAYERLEGVVHFAVDPAAPQNTGITDLRLAPTESSGSVRYAADFCVLRPAAPARTSGRLLFTVTNRGRHASVPFSALTAPPSAVVTTMISPGDGFLLRRAWTIAWCGWQWDVMRRPGLLGLAAPEARLPEGDPDREVLVQFQPHRHETHHSLGHWPLDPPPGFQDAAHRPYTPLDLDDPHAVMTVRDGAHGTRSEVPRSRWRFARAEAGAVVPDATCVWLAGGFEPGRIYDVRYRPRECPVVGAGLLAIRDFVSYLRHGPRDLIGPIAHAFGFGVSQSGRLLREFLREGLNVDEAGRAVFDGVLVHVAGARRGEFNQRFGQPSAQHTASLGHLPPFADEPAGGGREGLLDRQRRRGSVPRIFTINTSSEYWRTEASLVHMDEAGEADVEPPEEVRVYMFAGCQHGPGVLSSTRTSATSPWVRPANLLNTVDYTPLLRAAIVNLERWVVEGIDPPANAVPRLSDGTAVERGEVLRRFAAAGVRALPRLDRLPALRRLDLGLRTAEGIVQFPIAVGEPYRCFVSSVNTDLNENAGIRLPDLTVPFASHTGWNPRLAESGAEGQLIDMLGSSLPLSSSAAERYPSRERYCALVRKEAERMVLERLLLEEDIEPVVARAVDAYDAFSRLQS